MLEAEQLLWSVQDMRVFNFIFGKTGDEVEKMISSIKQQIASGNRNSLEKEKNALENAFNNAVK